MNYLLRFDSPQLNKIHAGKVRDSIRIDDNTRMIVVTDRLSAFDSVLKSPIPYKGAVLNGISNWWFQQTADIIGNHFIEQLDPNITLVKEAEPVRIEMIVRAYLTGSMWRGYAKGQRTFSGVSVPDGLRKNQAFPEPIVTPTTKEKSDRPITPANIVSEGWTSETVYEKMKTVALQLFERGSKHLADKGIILVDTKYEFGLLNGELILIDEIHTPDSSRFWDAADYAANPDDARQIDKEYVRQWLIANKKGDNYPDTLTEEVAEEASRRYREMYENITGNVFELSNEHTKNRIARNLVAKGLIKDGYVGIVMGSESDLPHCEKLKAMLENYGIHVFMRVTSAHKNGERIACLADIWNNSVEPGAAIAVAGRSNGLGGALAANLAIPVFNCPPFKDKDDMMVNINSSLMMPSKTPAATAIQPDNAVLVALRSLNLPRLRERFAAEIGEMKRALHEADGRVASL